MEKYHSRRPGGKRQNMTKCKTRLLVHISSQFYRGPHSMFSDVLLIITLVHVERSDVNDSSHIPKHFPRMGITTNLATHS